MQKVIYLLLHVLYVFIYLGFTYSRFI